MIDPNIELTPDDDGKTHLNLASKAKTKLGKAMSNFGHYPFNHPKYGCFESVEGFQYWLILGGKHDELRLAHGYPAKQLGDRLCEENPQNVVPFTMESREDMLEALRCKLRQNRGLLHMLVNTKLPLVHYNWYGKNGNYKIYRYEDFQWFIDEVERIRTVCQEKWSN